MCYKFGSLFYCQYLILIRYTLYKFEEDAKDMGCPLIQDNWDALSTIEWLFIDIKRWNVVDIFEYRIEGHNIKFYVVI
jgi:hypothetical protein